MALYETIHSIMARRTPVVLPAVLRVLEELGENIRTARLRRKISAALLAERAGLSRPTLRRVERGDATVSMGAYASVLHSLGLVTDLAQVAADDQLGRKLQDAGLPSRRRAPRRLTATEEP